MNNDILKEFEDMLKNSTIRKFGKHGRRAYKYILCAIFINIINGEHNQSGQIYNIQLAKSILKNNKNDHEFEQLVKYVKPTVVNSLKDCFFYSPEEEKTLTEILAFFRTRINEMLAKEKSLFLAKDLNKILDVSKFYSKTNNKIKLHHWLDFDLGRGLVPTVPEFITYVDLLTTWNLYVDKKQQLNNKRLNLSEKYLSHEIDTMPEIRQLSYELGSLLRLLVVNAVTFTESFFYYYFYNVKESNLYGEVPELSKIFEKVKIEDTQIIEQLIFRIHKNIKEDHKIRKLYKEYKSINSIRNRYIHASAFMDESVQGMSQMQSMLNINQDTVQKFLETCLMLVKEIDEKLPEEERILFWWGRIGILDASKLEKVDIYNPIQH